MPLCFTSPRIFKLWLRADTSLPEAHRCNAKPCEDCQPSYQLRMKKLGRCEHPETVFGIDRAGGVFGMWPA